MFAALLKEPVPELGLQQLHSVPQGGHHTTTAAFQRMGRAELGWGRSGLRRGVGLVVAFVATSQPPMLGLDSQVCTSKISSTDSSRPIAMPAAFLREWMRIQWLLWCHLPQNAEIANLVPLFLQMLSCSGLACPWAKKCSYFDCMLVFLVNDVQCCFSLLLNCIICYVMFICWTIVFLWPVLLLAVLRDQYL